MHKSICYLNIHPNEPLIFKKYPESEERKIRIYRSENQSKDFTFQNKLESFKYLFSYSDKLLRKSCGMEIPFFCGAAFSWKMSTLFIPINSADS